MFTFFLYSNKNYSVCFFLLFTFFISGCEDSSVIQQTPKNTQKPSVVSKKAVKEPKKKAVLYKQVKKVVKPKLAKVNIPEKIEPKILDLSLSIRPQNKITLNQMAGGTPVDYLPDLFAVKKKKKAVAVQIDGKIISREEEEREKQRAVDGVTLGISLSH